MEDNKFSVPGIELVSVGPANNQLRYFRKREEDEAIQFLNKIKTGSPERPKEIHTDCSYDYPPAFRAVFPRRKIHRYFPAWKKKFKNNPIERLHNTLKQRYKTFRNFDNFESCEKFFDFFKFYYNFVRKHMSLGFKTPAQAAKIELSMGRNRFRSLIEFLLNMLRLKYCC